MLQVLRMLEAAKIETAGDILFVGTVGEEGNGDIRGAKALFDGSRKIDAFVALETSESAALQAVRRSYIFLESLLSGPWKTLSWIRVAQEELPDVTPKPTVSGNL